MKGRLRNIVGRPFEAVSGGLERPSYVACLLAGPILAGAIAAFAVQSEAGEAPASSAVAEGIRFRRVYVPADRLKDWPRDAARYVPMERAEFESLVERAGAPPVAAPQAVTGARYTARLVGDSLVDGEAVLDVAPLAAAPSTVWLTPCNLALNEATWLSEPRQPAVFAMGEDGKLGIRAARPGQLQLKWSLRGRANPTHVGRPFQAVSNSLERPSYGSIEFLLDLPVCPANHLVLLLPKQLAPQVERAVVLREGSAGEGADQWRIELGGRGRCRLRVVPRGDLYAASKLNTLQEALTYEFSLLGLELSAQWTLDVPSAPLRQLAVDLDPSLQLVAAHFGGESIPWSVMAAADPRKGTQVVLELPETFQGARRVLRLGAVATSVVGRPWRLPTMRPQGIFRQEAVATLIVPSPMTLGDLKVSGGRQTQTSPLPAPQSGQVAELQLFSPGAAIEVVLARPESPPEFDCGTALELSGVDMAAEVTARFRLAEGQRFQIDADVSARWIIDSVETVPANALEDWTVLRSGPGTNARLSIRLAKALCEARPLKVIVQSRHHYSPLGRLLTRDDLVPIEFHGSGAGRRLVSIRAAEAYQLRLPGAERLTRVDPRELTPADLELFDDRPEGLVFVDDAQARPVAIGLEPQTPSPARDAASASETSLASTRQETPSATHRAWAWSCHVESHYESGGTAHHLTTYRLQNAGRRRLLLVLPEGLGLDAVCGVWVDGVKVPREIAPEGDGDRLAVSLPAERKFPVVSVLLAVSGRSLGVANWLEPVLPQLDVPVLQSRWTVWLPPGYQSAVCESPGEIPWATPRSIAQRLFGPLGRPANSPWFRPWALDTRSPWGGRLEETSRARQYAELLFERLGSLQQPSPPDGVWMEQLARAAAGPGPTLLVDRLALARAGVQCRSVIPEVVGETATDRGLAMFEQADLSLLVANDAVLLTSAAEVALNRGYLAPSGMDSVWLLLPSPLAEQLALAAEANQDPTLVSLETWSRLPASCGDPWTRSLPTVQGPTEPLGWSAYRMELPAEADLALPVVHSDTIRGLGWSVFVGVFSLLAWRRSRTAFPGRPGWSGKAVLHRLSSCGDATLTVLLALLAAVAALLVPEPFSPLPAGALWAALAVAGLQRAQRREPAAAGSADSTATRRRAASAVPVRAILVLLATASAYAWCGAVRGEPAGPSPADAVHKVLIPIDDKQQPAGDKYYVPESLFSQLQTTAASRAEERRGWVLSSAVYRGISSWRTAPEQFAMEELRASYDLQVFSRQVRVRIPVGRTGVEILPDGVVLEGRSIQPVWPDAEGNMAFDVAEPGRYRLELALRPVARSAGGKSLVEWKIPRLATSRLEMTIPSDAPDVEFPSAMGAIVPERDPSRVVVALGPADRLQVAWPEAAARGAERCAVDVEQLLWMKLRPDSVVLDTLLSFRVLEGRIRVVQLAVDPRLRYFPSANDRSPVARATIEPGQPQVLRMELSQPAGDKVVVPATFQLQESSGVGNYRLPLVDVLNARTTKRWLGLSVDPSLEYSQSRGQQLPPIALPSFVAAWGGVKSPPLAAWDLSSPRPDWNVATRPTAARIAAQQVLTVSLAARSARVLLDANLVVSGDAVFQHRIAAPRELEIERISAREGGSERVARWARADDGAVIVFLNGPTRGEQQLTLRGRLPAPEQGKLPLPVVRLEAEPANRPSGNREARPKTAETSETAEVAGTAAKPMEILLFRDPAVHVDVRDPVGLIEAKTLPADESRGPPERLVKAFQVQTPEVSGISRAFGAVLVISPNRPKIQAEQITWMRSTDDTWQSEVEFRLKVADGLADQFSLEVPPHWTGPYKTQAPATLKLTEATGRPNRELLIRPRAAVEGDFRLSVSGPLKLGPNERPAVPKIVPQGVAVTRHWVILPVEPKAAAMSWETRGLIAAKLPEDSLVPPADRGSVAAYLAVGADFQAMLRVGDPVVVRPQVHLAEFRIAWRADGTYHALASYDLEPAGLASCPLALPSESRLVQVFVGGQSAVVVPEGPERWQVPLASTTLPQRIEVLFVGEVTEPGRAGSRDFAMPSLGEIPVRQSIWTVTAPSACRLGAIEALDGLTPVHYALSGLRNLAAILDRVAETPGVDSDSLARWYRDWAGRWLVARTEAARQLVWAKAVSETAAVRTEVESLEKRQAAASERLGLSGVMARVTAEAGPREEAAAIWLFAAEARRAAIQSGTTADPSVVSVSYEEHRGPGMVPRLLAALAIAVLGLAAAWGSGRGVLPKLLLRWPYVTCLAIGLVWWWLLTPSVLGFGLTVACLAAAAWSYWRKRTIAGSPMVSIP